MHAIAAMVRRLRAAPAERGLVAANGGFLSKYSVGIYSARPATWKGFDSKALQAEIDSWPTPAVVLGDGAGVVDTYTIDYSVPTPVATVIGRLNDGGARFVAMSDPTDDTIVRQMIAADPLGAAVTAKPNDEGRSSPQDVRPASDGELSKDMGGPVMKWHFADLFETVASPGPGQHRAGQRRCPPYLARVRGARRAYRPGARRRRPGARTRRSACTATTPTNTSRLSSGSSRSAACRSTSTTATSSTSCSTCSTTPTPRRSSLTPSSRRASPPSATSSPS